MKRYASACTVAQLRTIVNSKLGENERSKLRTIIKNSEQVQRDLRQHIDIQDNGTTLQCFVDTGSYGATKDLTLGYVNLGTAVLLGRIQRDNGEPVKVFAMYLSDKGELRAYVPRHGNPDDENVMLADIAKRLVVKPVSAAKFITDEMIAADATRPLEKQACDAVAMLFSAIDYDLPVYEAIDAVGPNAREVMKGYVLSKNTQRTTAWLRMGGVKIDNAAVQEILRKCTVALRKLFGDRPVSDEDSADARRPTSAALGCCPYTYGMFEQRFVCPGCC